MEKKQEMALVKFGIDPNQVIKNEGRYWMTAEQLGIALGFKKPRRSVINLFNRHKKELEPFKGVINMVTPSAGDGRGGGIQETTVFDTDGQYRIALLANTPKAEKFRSFIVNMLKALERQEFIHINQVMEWRQDLIELGISRLLDSSKVMDWKKYQKMLRYREIGLTQKETAKLLDVSKDTIKRMEAIPRKYELKLLKGGANNG